jgi:drug/metabolite transporter (DMT)-like permease
MALAAAVALACICCAVFVIIRLIRQKKMTVPFASILILCVTMCISYMNYCLGYQITSTESLRFIIPVLLPAGLFFGMTLQELKKKNPAKVIIAAVIVLFICGVFAFYGSYAEYRPVWEAFIKPA